MKRFTLFLAATVLLAACAEPAPSGGEADVPTLLTPGAKAPGATTSGATAPGATTGNTTANDRPVIRPDATEEEIRRLENLWAACLVRAGVPHHADEAGNYGKPQVDLTAPEYRGAVESCASLQPESWLDRERRTDPQFTDRLLDAVTCLKAKGYQARVETEDEPRIAYATTEEFLRADADQETCLREAFKAAS
ncbi:hypothetical protein [Catenuloplanes japonicus]|uniref:hypothetical protein n=1 Tax=Catenuloplanes japonicus TaxID=33876 RepID=UPI0005247B8C|nr:hypothetical protein [Catenuloplanes japonicus]